MHATSGYTSATTSVVPLLLKENARSLRVMNCEARMNCLRHKEGLSLRLASQSTSLVRWRLCCNSIHDVSRFMERSEYQGSNRENTI